MSANPVREGTERPGSAAANPVRTAPLVLLRPAKVGVAELLVVPDSGLMMLVTLDAGALADLVAQGAWILRNRVQANAHVPSERPRGGPA